MSLHPSIALAALEAACVEADIAHRSQVVIPAERMNEVRAAGADHLFRAVSDSRGVWLVAPTGELRRYILRARS